MKTKNVVTNTTEEVQRDPHGAIIQLMSGGRGIEQSEAQGQRELVQSEVLPRDAMNVSTMLALTTWGVRFGASVENDPLFVHVELPAGWKKQATDHAMWSDLLDEKGRKRAAIFYKAAFYDRSARIRLLTRFQLDLAYDEKCEAAPAARKCSAVDCDGTVLFSTDWVTPTQEDYHQDCDRARDPVVAWLNENKPGWEDPMKYWDEP